MCPPIDMCRRGSQHKWSCGRCCLNNERGRGLKPSARRVSVCHCEGSDEGGRPGCLVYPGVPALRFSQRRQDFICGCFQLCTGPRLPLWRMLRGFQGQKEHFGPDGMTSCQSKEHCWYRRTGFMFTASEAALVFVLNLGNCALSFVKRHFCRTCSQVNSIILHSC